MKSRDELLTAVQDDDIRKLQSLCAGPYTEIVKGWTLLHSCAEFGAVKTLEAFSEIPEINLEVPQTCRGAGGERPVHVAASCGRQEFVEALLRTGADPDALNNDKETALHLGVQTHELRLDEAHNTSKTVYQVLGVVKALLANGASINRQSDIGFSVLHFLADPLQEDARYQEILGFLLANGANPNLQDRDGDTPLHVLARCSDWWSRKGAFAMLLDHGADRGLKNQFGETALEIYRSCAKKSEDTETLTKMLTPSLNRKSE